jgi:hypothetical protein
VQLWSDAGIASVRVRHMSLGGGVVIWGTRVGGKRADGGAATA